MTDYRRIMELALQQRSFADIVELVGCSRRDVSTVKKTITARGITPGLLASMTSADIKALFPDGRQRVCQDYEQPDYASVLKSMKANRHFTLQQAWSRYVATSATGKKYGYAQYCHLFGEYLRTNDLVATLHHEPGRAMLVDWAGDTIALVDTVTGEVTPAFLFVAVLPFSGVVFVYPALTQTMEAWLEAHVAAFAFYGGVTRIVVPDNPTTSTYRPHRGDPQRVVNPRYQQLADHYGCAIVPARVKRPRDKAAAESAVNVVNKRVIGYLSEDVWTTLGELRQAVAERVWEINHEIRRADGTTRWELFTGEEASLLQPLPVDRFEQAEWKQLTVGRNYHITCDYQHYSIPVKYVGRVLRVRVTPSTITVFDGVDTVCAHPRLTGRKGQYSTLEEHVPPQHRSIDGLWSRQWFLDLARSHGPATVTVIVQILDRHTIEAQGYLDCQNILSGLGKRNKARLEAACQQVVNQRLYPTYTTIKRVMAGITSGHEAPRPVVAAGSTRKPAVGDPSHLVADVYVRDASHYNQQVW